ncbi:unnamed protein product [Rhodiola kirilowii]
MTLKEGQSTTRPPLLDGSNYASWKPKMKSFLKSLDERAWKAVLTGWTEPTMEISHCRSCSETRSSMD